MRKIILKPGQVSLTKKLEPSIIYLF